MIVLLFLQANLETFNEFVIETMKSNLKTICKKSAHQKWAQSKENVASNPKCMIFFYLQLWQSKVLLPFEP